MMKISDITASISDMPFSRPLPRCANVIIGLLEKRSYRDAIAGAVSQVEARGLEIAFSGVKNLAVRQRRLPVRGSLPQRHHGGLPGARQSGGGIRDIVGYTALRRNGGPGWIAHGTGVLPRHTAVTEHNPLDKHKTIVIGAAPRTRR